ncbi:MAG: DNA replication complex subunit Gins51 [Candidatus Odinarchaeia archaeon]
MYDELYKAWLSAYNNKNLDVEENLSEKAKTYLNKLLDDLPEKEGLMKKIYEEKISNLQYILTCIDNICSVEYSPTAESESALNSDTKSIEKTETIKKQEKIEQQGINSTLLDKPKYLIIRIREEIPPIVGSDLKTYGPFKPEDIAAVPVKNAELLIKKGAAVKINWG